MGNIEYIDELEQHIKDLSDEIVKVKKASDYLKLIEEFQEEVKGTSSILSQSNKQLTLNQQIIERKLELFKSTIQNIESKHLVIEESQKKILTLLDSLGNHQEKSQEIIADFFNEVNNQIEEKQNKIKEELSILSEEHSLLLNRNFKRNNIYFIINVFFSISILVVLILFFFK